MSDKSTKKELLLKIDDLEKELNLYKNKTQLARNYGILVEEVAKLNKEINKKKEYWQAQCEKCKEKEEEEEEEEEETDEEDC